MHGKRKHLNIKNTFLSTALDKKSRTNG